MLPQCPGGHASPLSPGSPADFPPGAAKPAHRGGSAYLLEKMGGTLENASRAGRPRTAEMGLLELSLLSQAPLPSSIKS